MEIKCTKAEFAKMIINCDNGNCKDCALSGCCDNGLDSLIALCEIVSEDVAIIKEA